MMAKNNDLIIATIIGFIIVGLGIVRMGDFFKSAIRSVDRNERIIDSNKQQKNLKERMKENKRRQRETMDRNKQKIKDMQRRR